MRRVSFSYGRPSFWPAVACALMVASSSGAGLAASDPPDAPAPPAVRQSNTVLIVRVEGDDGVIARLHAELAFSAWQIVEITANAKDSELRTLAAQHAAAAAVRCDVARGLELWVASSTSSSPGTLDIIDVAGTSRDPGVPVWRVMETLRARGLRLSDPSPPPPAPPQPLASERRAAEERRLAAARSKAAQGATERARREGASAHPRQLALELGPAYVWSPGGLGGTVNGWGKARFDAGSWSLSALLLAPLATSRLARVEGEARISTVIAAASADVTWLELRALRFSSGVGLGPSVTTMTGTVRAGYVAATVRQWVPTAFLRSGVRMKLGNSLALGGSALLGATMHPISVEFAERRVATWGSPWLACVLSIELTHGL